MPTRQDEKWNCRWICPECEEHGRLPHCDLFFAPDICPGCGTEKPLERVKMRYDPPKYDYIGIFPVKQEHGKWKIHADDKDWKAD